MYTTAVIVTFKWKMQPYLPELALVLLLFDTCVESNQASKVAVAQRAREKRVRTFARKYSDALASQGSIGLALELISKGFKL